MATTMSFDTAFSELEKLVVQIEDENLQLDELAQRVTMANELLSFCESKLRLISIEVEEQQ